MEVWVQEGTREHSTTDGTGYHVLDDRSVTMS